MGIIQNHKTEKVLLEEIFVAIDKGNLSISQITHILNFDFNGLILASLSMHQNFSYVMNTDEEELMA